MMKNDKNANIFSSISSERFYASRVRNKSHFVSREDWVNRAEWKQMTPRGYNNTAVFMIVLQGKQKSQNTSILYKHYYYAVNSDNNAYCPLFFVSCPLKL